MQLRAAEEPPQEMSEQVSLELADVAQQLLQYMKVLNALRFPLSLCSPETHLVASHDSDH